MTNEKTITTLPIEPASIVSGENRFLLLAAAWLFTGLASSIANGPRLLLYFWLFPLGIVRIIFPNQSTAPFQKPLAGGWLFYAILTLCASVVKRRARFVVIYSILCGVLIINMVGCHQIRNELISYFGLQGSSNVGNQ